MLEVVEVELVPGLVVAGKWRLERAIGQGGFGVVWAAVDVTTGQRLALKCLTKEGASDAKRQERLRREARAMASISHPHIAHVFGLEELPAGTPFIVMELLEGRTLYNQLLRGPMSVAQARGILIQIADALRTVHARGIIHRDLKPANVIIIDDRYAKVLDFGISKDLSAGEVKQLTTTGMALGTLNYMAPEQIFGERNLDPRCDVWALGVIAHECLTLSRPTDGEGPNSGQVLKTILEGNFPRLSTKIPDCPPDIDELVARMLQRNAADRPTSEEVFTTLALPAISPTMRRSLRKDQLLATLPISEVPIFAQTIRDPKFAASQLVPSTVVPPTVVPPTEWTPSSAMAPTVIPSTAMPPTAMPSTALADTMLPSTAVPSTQMPSTHVPSTQIPSTQVPATVLVAQEQPRNTPIGHAPTMVAAQHRPSSGGHVAAPAVTPHGYARAVEQRPSDTTVVVEARARAAAARSRSFVLALALFAGIGVIVIAIFAVNTLRARRADAEARAAASASAASASNVAAQTPPVASATSSAAAPVASTSASPSASPSASVSASASAPKPVIAGKTTAAPPKTGAPTGRTPPPATKPTGTAHGATHGDPPISNERF